MRIVALVMTCAALAAAPTLGFAADTDAQCRDAAGQPAKCAAPAPKPTLGQCRDAAGKPTKCDAGAAKTDIEGGPVKPTAQCGDGTTKTGQAGCAAHGGAASWEKK
jgi:hypothetical protein